MIDPFDKKADKIIRTKFCSPCIGQQVFNQVPFFLCVRLIPRAKTLTDKWNIRWGLNPLFNLLIEIFESV
jgi:hypothetical protein